LKSLSCNRLGMGVFDRPVERGLLSFAKRRPAKSRTAARGCRLALLFGICFPLLSVNSEARVHRSQAWAENQFTKAEAQRETLSGRDEQARTRREYETVIESYRRIVLEAPTSSKADNSAFLAAQLTAEMGRHFKDDVALYSAVREYKYLRKEYPGSKHRIEALLAIGEIYKNDLGDDSDARAAFEELVRRYPHSKLVIEAQAELSASTDEASSGKEESDADSDQAQNENAQNDNEGARQNDIPAEHNPGKDSDQRASSSANPEKLVRVKDVQYWSMPDYTRVSIDLEQDVQFESERIDHPDRIFFDLKNARLASHLSGQNFDVEDGLVKKLRVAQYKPGRARIVIETENHAAYNASLILNPPRLVIDIHSEDNRGDSHPNESSDVSETNFAQSWGSDRGRSGTRTLCGRKSGSPGCAECTQKGCRRS